MSTARTRTRTLFAGSREVTGPMARRAGLKLLGRADIAITEKLAADIAEKALYANTPLASCRLYALSAWLWDNVLGGEP